MAFLLKSARRRRLASGDAIPSEFFYGYIQLRDAGWCVDLIEQDDLGVGLSESVVWAPFNWLSDVFLGLHLRALYQLAGKRSRRRLADFAFVIVAQNSLGFCLCLLHAIGVVKAKPVFIVMGGLDTAIRGLAGYTRRRLLSHAVAASLSKGETAGVADRHGIRLNYVPFGVDTKFWTPAPDAATADYVMSIGNDSHRDFTTLIDAWQPEFPVLKIVSRIVQGPVPSNVEVISGHYDLVEISDADIRELYRGARFVVIPLTETLQPSGQSACLQAMACGKAVVLSDIAGLWDRELMRDAHNCVLVPPGDTDALRRAVRSLLADEVRAGVIGRAARTTVEDDLNVEAMTDSLSALCLREQHRSDPI